MKHLQTTIDSPRQLSDVIPVLFISGTGRSGSTLLDRLVSTHRHFCSIGELRFIWERSYGQNQLCGCGLPFHQCSFWKEVSYNAFGVDPADVDQTAIIKLKESIDRIRYAPWLVQSRRPKRYQTALSAYGKMIERLYAAVVEVSGTQVIVDSSKDPTHGLVLSQLPGLEVHVVHLVRDPRAVAFSWKRPRKRPEIHWKAEDMPIERVSTSATRWMMHNTQAELFSKSAASYSRLRYEDFLVDPSATLTKIYAPFGWTDDDRQDTDHTEVLLEPIHSVSGNPMRFTHGPLKLKLDDEWRDKMSPHDRRLVTTITFPLLVRYGYQLGADYT
jgi:hypothetical protein